MSQKNPTLDVNDSIAKSEAFIAKYKNYIIIGLVAIAVIVAGGFAGRSYLQGQNEKAQAQIGLGQRYFATGEWDTALKGDGTFKGFEKLAKGSAFIDATNLAQAYAGICYFNKGDYKKAITFLEDFSPKGDATISANVLAALGNAYAADKQLEKAVSTLKAAADKADNPALSPLYLLQAGQILESQNKKEEANKIYTDLKKDYPTSQLASPNYQNGQVIGAEIDKYIERTK